MPTDEMPTHGAATGFDPATATRQEIMATFLANDLQDGEILQIGATHRWHQCQESRQLGQFQGRHDKSPFIDGKPADRLDEVAFQAVIGQRNRRLQRAVKTIEARLGSDCRQSFRGDAWRRALGARLSGLGIAAEPLARGRGQPVLGSWRVIERVALGQAVRPRVPMTAKRIFPESQSIVDTVTRIIRIRKATCGHSAWAISLAR